MSQSYTDTQTFWQKTKRFFEPMKYHKIVALRQFLYYSSEALFGVAFVFFIRHIIEALENQNIEMFYNILIIYGGVFIVLFVFIAILHDAWTYTFNRFRETIEEKYLPQFVTFDTNAFEKVGTGKSIAIISKGVQLWGRLLDLIIQNISYFGITFILAIYLLGEVSYVLVGVFIGLLFVTTFIGLFLNSKVLLHRKKRIELDNQWSKRMVGILMSKMEILQTKKIHTEIEELHKLHEGQIYYNKKMSPYLVPFFALGFVITTSLLYVVFMYFGSAYFTGEVSLGMIAALAGTILMMQKVFLTTLDFIKNFSKEFAEIENLWFFFDSTPQIIGYEEGNIFKYKTGDIDLKNISYSYTENTPVLKDFSLSLAGGKVTAFVGPSGGGKSTLVKLIAGYIRADSGEIMIDRQKLSETSLKSYYSSVGYLTQEPSVFDGTVRENLLYAVENDTKQEQKLDEVIRLAHCEFIYNLPNGLDTEIGERGVKLSGGQKQRLAIAKIFLKNPKIIILDEPTSALDSLSEKKITEAMHNLFKNRTVLVIAHRLQTVKHADDIIVIDSGSVIERGTHAELIEKNGYYAEMLELQSGF
ncbi:ABC transporter ATP-binding protein/permease [Candidatus Gracilibacteria bacterium]|nr:ABC transporter ATP-binding protein/permease [Candidatus Gracilibacteria bacterium]